ncbi:hypothetical protein YWIDRAFT_00060 [Streptomyces sp. SceaMP-e96]|nr:hypothetical protein YWIDRAFT_00060 [Streptomyces sp. SceaMP-e96]
MGWREMVARKVSGTLDCYRGRLDPSRTVVTAGLLARGEGGCRCGLSRNCSRAGAWVTE